LGRGGGLRTQPLRLTRHVARPARQAVSAAGALFRRWRHEDVRRGLISPPAAGFWRVAASRRHLTGLADHLPRTGAVLRKSRADVPRPWAEGPGSDRAAR